MVMVFFHHSMLTKMEGAMQHLKSPLWLVFVDLVAQTERNDFKLSGKNRKETHAFKRRRHKYWWGKAIGLRWPGMWLVESWIPPESSYTKSASRPGGERDACKFTLSWGIWHNSLFWIMKHYLPSHFLASSSSTQMLGVRGCFLVSPHTWSLEKSSMNNNRLHVFLP